MKPAALTSPEVLEGDEIECGIRPQSLSDFTGQPQVIENLDVFIRAPTRGEALDHVLLYGPPGLGKTTLANIVSKEMGVNFRSTSGPLLTKAGDLAAILTNLQANDVLFIDEIHRLSMRPSRKCSTRRWRISSSDLIIGEGPSARTVRIDLPQFTLVGATTRIGLLTGPLRDRFGIPLKLNFYDVAELKKVVSRASSLLKVSITPDGANEIAKRSCGTPRIAVRLLKRVRDLRMRRGRMRLTRCSLM